MPVRGIRGAITAAENTESSILTATMTLLREMIARNAGLEASDLASAWFTVTPDLDTAYPAKATRQFGWQLVPMMCSTEIPVPDGLPHCIRVLLHWNTSRNQDEISHVYIGEAAHLRPDLSS
ncbi:MAG: chorismate mutase [Chloroflexi bacterium HGW-Chloroflexi-3]|nr:MAG: chorismate mutase [Chloroflexi bacterium HGW-Chloroflexi-3]